MAAHAGFSFGVLLIVALSLGNCYGRQKPAREFSFEQPDISCRGDYAAQRCCPLLPSVLSREAAPKQLLLVLGPLKTGSNFLFNALSKHPNIRGAKQKETFFFLRNGENNSTIDLKNYLEFWPEGGDVEKDVFLEASVAYLMTHRVPCLIKHSVPNAKFIVILRDPVARMWSYIDMIRRKCVKSQDIANKWYDCHEVFKPFSEIVAREMDELNCDSECKFDSPQDGYAWTDCSLARRMETVNGIYAPQIAHWFKYFDPSQFLFLGSEDLTSDTANQINKVLDFVGLPRAPHPEVDSRGVFSYSGEYIWKDQTLVETQNQLNKFYQQKNEELIKYLSLNGHNISMWSSEQLKSGSWDFPGPKSSVSGAVQYRIQEVYLRIGIRLWDVLMFFFAVCAVGIGFSRWQAVKRRLIKKDAKSVV